MNEKSPQVHAVTVRLNDENYQQLCDLAAKRKMSQNALITQLIEHQWKVELPEKWEEALIEQQKRIAATLKALRKRL